jgi:hypothetical protein
LADACFSKMKVKIGKAGETMNLKFTRASKATFMTGDADSIYRIVFGIRTLLYT